MAERARAPLADCGSRAHRLDGLLKRHARSVTALGGARWRFRVPGRRRVGVAVLDDDWLRLSVSLPGSKALHDIDRVGRQLERNATLPAGVRIVRDGTPAADCMIAEISVSALDWARPDDRLPEIDNVMRNLSRALGPARIRQRSNDAEADLPAELAERLAELGWRCQTAAPARWSVQLDVAAAYHTATLERRGGAVRVQAPLPAGAPSSPAGRAVAWLAWQVASRLALVKPVRSSGALALEVVLDSMDAHAVDDALAALSVAFRRCAREIAVLASSTEIATSYLLLQGHSVPRDADRPRHAERTDRFL